MAQRALGGKTIYPRNDWGQWGLNPPSLNAGAKPELFPVPFFAAIEILCGISFLVLTAGVRGRWAVVAARPAGAFLLILAATQFFPMLERGGLERYYIPLAAPLLPLAAWIAQSSRLGKTWALMALAAGVALYVAGQQDYEAWQAARDRAAHLAYATVPPAQVWTGYETYGVYVDVPLYERTGHLTRPITPDDPVPTLDGPLHLVAVVQFAPRGDPRPGYDYSSLASGRIVVAR
jgi:hypothetical protein